MDWLQSLYVLCSARLPSVILTDRCIACINAVATCFPSLCLWHATKAVLRHCQPTFTRQQQGLEAWNEDLFEAWRPIKHALLNQLPELKSNQAKQVRVPIELSWSLYSAVHGLTRGVKEGRRTAEAINEKRPAPLHRFFLTISRATLCSRAEIVVGGESRPPGGIRTNQQYRRAMGLPLRYDKASYRWCLETSR